MISYFKKHIPLTIRFIGKKEKIMSENKIEIVLERLTEEEESFLDKAIKNFERDMPWDKFDEFAFGSDSILYKYDFRNAGLTENPLCLVLNAMWLKLGVRHGYIPKEKDKTIIIRYGTEMITIN